MKEGVKGTRGQKKKEEIKGKPEVSSRRRVGLRDRTYLWDKGIQMGNDNKELVQNPGIEPMGEDIKA
jgi:hypothetical protein